ncbi:MAG: hypothetical protein Q9164_002336 [Protoblastenia rupestris]
MTMDKVIEIETSEDYASWRWYASALQQHHYALLMATEIIMNPRRKESSRIWKGLDYVFEPPPLPPIARARWIITQAWWKMEVYIGKRQLRVPINLEQNLKEALKLSEDKPRGERRSSASTEATSVEDDSAQIAQSQSAKRQGQPAKKRTTSSKDNKSRGGVSPTPPKASRGSEGAQVRPPMDKSGTTADQPHTQPSPSIGAPAKQMMDVDWGVLNSYFSPEVYTGDLDVPFDTWTDLLQSTPFPTGNKVGNIALEPSSQYAFQYTSDAPTLASIPQHINPEDSAGLWGGTLAPPPASIPAAQFTDYSAEYSAPRTTQPSPQTIWSGTQASNPKWSNVYQTQQGHQPFMDQHSYQPQLAAQQQIGHQQWSGDPHYASAPNADQRPQQQPANELNFGMPTFRPIQRRPI